MRRLITVVDKISEVKVSSKEIESGNQPICHTLAIQYP